MFFWETGPRASWWKRWWHWFHDFFSLDCQEITLTATLKQYATVSTATQDRLSKPHLYALTSIHQFRCRTQRHCRSSCRQSCQLHHLIIAPSTPPVSSPVALRNRIWAGFNNGSPWLFQSTNDTTGSSAPESMILTNRSAVQDSCPRKSFLREQGRLGSTHTPSDSPRPNSWKNQMRGHCTSMGFGETFYKMKQK